MVAEFLQTDMFAQTSKFNFYFNPNETKGVDILFMIRRNVDAIFEQFNQNPYFAVKNGISILAPETDEVFPQRQYFLPATEWEIVERIETDEAVSSYPWYLQSTSTGLRAPNDRYDELQRLADKVGMDIGRYNWMMDAKSTTTVAISPAIYSSRDKRSEYYRKLSKYRSMMRSIHSITEAVSRRYPDVYVMATLLSSLNFHVMRNGFATTTAEQNASPEYTYCMQCNLCSTAIFEALLHSDPAIIKWYYDTLDSTFADHFGVNAVQHLLGRGSETFNTVRSMVNSVRTDTQSKYR